MRTTPNDPATCLHEDPDVQVDEIRDRYGRLIRLDAAVICDDCEQLLDRTSHTPKGPDDRAR